jgi:hypothetical protein
MTHAADALYLPGTTNFGTYSSTKIYAIANAVLGYNRVHDLWQEAYRCEVKPADVTTPYIIKANNGEDVPVVISYFYGTPCLNGFKLSPKFKNYTVRDGRRGSPRVFITWDKTDAANFRQTDEYKAAMARHKTAQETYWKNIALAFDKKARIEVAAVLPSFAELEELSDKITAMDAASKMEWFEVRGYANLPSLEVFSLMTGISRITLSSGPDGYGHQCGSEIFVDHVNKTFSNVYGWSSDD